MGAPCREGCTCGRHRDKKCEPGCTCGRHTAPHPPHKNARKSKIRVDIDELRRLAPFMPRAAIAARLGTTRKVIDSRMAEFGIAGRPYGKTNTSHAARHKRIAKKYGKAAQFSCAFCAKAARDWAEIRESADCAVWEDHMPLCRSCHIKYDYNARFTGMAREKWLAKAPQAIAAAWTPERRKTAAQVMRRVRLMRRRS